MQKLLRSSKLSCSKPFITLLKQQISNCCTVKKSHGQCALLSDCYPHKSSVVVCTLCISNASIARWDFFTVQQFDICCFRSVMKGLLQLSFELRRSFCINICCFIIRINDSRVISCSNHICKIRHIFVPTWPIFQKQVTWPLEIIDHWPSDRRLFAREAEFFTIYPTARSLRSCAAPDLFPKGRSRDQQIIGQSILSERFAISRLEFSISPWRPRYATFLCCTLT